MQLNPSEISELLKSRIEGLGASTDVRTQGTVVSVTDGITRIHGLSDVMQGEMLEFPNNRFGLALNLERDSVGAVILGDYVGVSEGDAVKTTGKILSVPVGPELRGRVVDALGNPPDGKGPINAKETDVIEKVAPGVIARQSVSQPLQTGQKAIDSMVPVGRGQRELIIGERVTAKTVGAPPVFSILKPAIIQVANCYKFYAGNAECGFGIFCSHSASTYQCNIDVVIRAYCTSSQKFEILVFSFCGKNI